MTNRPIYFIREPRCGGTHFVATILDLCKNKHRKKQIEYVDTHDMSLATHLDKRLDPIVIRCDRHSLVDHFFSIKFIEYTYNFTNIRFYETMDDHPSLKYGLEQKVTISEETVQEYVASRLKIHLRFLKDTRGIDTTTIYYEDWHKRFDLPSLGLYDIDLCNGMQYTKKLPDYKRTVFVNYDEAASWIEKYKNDYLKIYNVEKLFEHWTSYSSS